MMDRDKKKKPSPPIGGAELALSPAFCRLVPMLSAAVLRKKRQMIAYEISHNGKIIAVVGANDLIGLNTVLMACGDLNGVSGAVRLFNMTALGMAKGSRANTTLHHTWTVAPAKGQFNVGDTLTIRIIETRTVTPPTSSQELENEDAEAEDAGDSQ